MLPRFIVLSSLVFASTWSVGACTKSARGTFVFQSKGEPKNKLIVETYGGAVNLEADPAATTVTGAVEVYAGGFKKKGDAVAAARAVTLVEQGDPKTSLQLLVSVPPTTTSSERFEVSLNLRVPAGVTVSVLTDSAPIRVVGLGALDLTTTAGSVELVNTGGNARIRTDDAPVSVDGHTGSLDVATSHAQVDLFSVIGNVSARTSDGMITARVLPPRGGEVALSTVNAGIDLAVPYEFGARFTGLTTGTHSIYVEDLDFRPAFDEPGRLEGTLFDGLGNLDARTTEADIRVHRK